MNHYDEIDKSDYTRDIREPAPPPPPPPPAAPPRPRRPSRLVLFILAFLPGLGHMYLGLMRRGLFYLSAFAFAIFITVQFGMMGVGAIIVLAAFTIVAVVAAAFFEALVARRDIAMGRELADNIPAFAKTTPFLVAVGLLIIIPFLVNILRALSWLILPAVVLIGLGIVFGWFKKKPE